MATDHPRAIIATWSTLHFIMKNMFHNILLNALRGVAGKKCTPRKSLRGAAALNGRLPPEDGSDRPQTSGKRVSGDPRHFIFRRHKHFFATKIFVAKHFSSTVRKIFQQSACFVGAVHVYTPMSNAAREFIARTIGFSLLRPLAEG